MDKKNYQEDLLSSLKKPEEAVNYLKASLEETDMPELFLLALRNVAEAWGMGLLARKAQLNRESLYRMLSKKGNPELASVYSLLNTMGMRLSVELKD